MLIPSSRLSEKDMALWCDLASTDETHFLSSPCLRRFENAKRVIIDFSKNKKEPFYLGISWGKDSIVLLHLFIKLGIKCPVFYLRQLDNENPDSLKVRDLFLSKYDFDYREIAYSYQDADSSWYKKGKPNKWYLSLDKLKREHGCHVTGIRAEESGKRKKRMAVFSYETPNSFAPLGWIKTLDVFGYLAFFDLPIHSSYAMLHGGLDRLSIRVNSIGNSEGTGIGRRKWEEKYYGDILRRMTVKRYKASQNINR